MGSHFIVTVLISLCCQPVIVVSAGRSTITFANRGEGLVVNEEDNFVKVCLQRNGSVDELEQSETVYIQAKETQPEPMSGTGMDMTVEEETASAGEDFSSAPVAVRFGPWQTSACVRIPIFNDSIDEDREEFEVVVLRESGVQGLQVEERVGSLPITIQEMDGSVAGDPLFIVPLTLSRTTLKAMGAPKVGLCFEVHGTEHGIFNLVSDLCVSVNARFSLASDPTVGNIMSQIGVTAVDNDGKCCQIYSDLYTKEVAVDGRAVVNSHFEGGISVRRRENVVRVAVPNCNQAVVVFYITFLEVDGVGMMKFVIAKGESLSTTSHGLLGQFWNTPVSLKRGSSTDYTVRVHSFQSGERNFSGELYPLTWDQQYRPCVYSGNGQGFPVIEGSYKQYRMEKDLFDTDFEFSQFSFTQCIP